MDLDVEAGCLLANAFGVSSRKSLRLCVRTRAFTRVTERVKAFAPGGERLSNLPWCLTHKAVHFADLRLVRDYLRRGFAHFELGAHFLDLRGLLFDLRRQDFHFFLLLRDR
jgi:hypothetical protein